MDFASLLFALRRAPFPLCLLLGWRAGVAAKEVKLRCGNSLSAPGASVEFFDFGAVLDCFENGGISAAELRLGYSRVYSLESFVNVVLI